MNPLKYDEWLSENYSEIETKYSILHDEYGDAMNCLLCEYKEQKYKEYLEKLLTNFLREQQIY